MATRVRATGAFVLLVVLSATLAVATPEAEAADECRGLQVCLPVAGPWVKIPAPTKGAATSTAVWELRCPLRGYIVAGIDARVSDRGIDVSFRGESGSPVSPGVTTGAAVLFTAVATGPARHVETFRPFIGCIPVSGGGGRAATSHARAVATFPPAKPLERRVTAAPVRRGQARTLRASCRVGERLIGSNRSIAIVRERRPDARMLAAIRISGMSRGRVAIAHAGATRALPAGVRALAQVHALCARTPS